MSVMCNENIRKWSFVSYIFLWIRYGILKVSKYVCISEEEANCPIHIETLCFVVKVVTLQCVLACNFKTLVRVRKSCLRECSSRRACSDRMQCRIGNTIQV